MIRTGTRRRGFVELTLPSHHKRLLHLVPVRHTDVTLIWN